jgi:hypothetical protein
MAMFGFARSAPAQTDNSGTTEVLLSFPMADKGVLFGQWLRGKIMQQRGWHATNAVYIDNIACREFSDTTITMDTRQLGQRRWFRAENGEKRMESKGVVFFGAANPNWNAYYLKAMSQAKIMILVGTEGWLDSRNCVKEYVQFGDENRRRASAGQPALKGLCLTFPREQGGMPDAAITTIAQHGWQILSVSRVPIREFPYCNLGAWGLTETGLKQVLAEIP